MLVQSQPNQISLLPALPASWSQGSIRGVRARGGIVVEHLDWDVDSIVSTLGLVAGSAAARDGDLVKVLGPDGTHRSVDLSNGPVTVRFSRTSASQPESGVQHDG